MKQVFAPGCGLMLYKPESAQRLHALLNQSLGPMDMLMVCCHHDPQFKSKTEVINICPGCDKRFRNDHANSTTVSLWEILAQGDFFSFPDYKGQKMSILDACPTRDQQRVHKAVRTLLKKMNIELAEPKHTGTKSTCCGDSFYGAIPVEQVKEQMAKRAGEMPAEEVAVYCISCIKSMHIGGKRPRYLIDLLFGQETAPGTFEPDQWHRQLDEYIEKH
ncbi:(Fe-S)-binding protein [candidate division TA06 bacterium]|nr:(Fe-S)-binding protein [candidate division TA06 bacterium]